MTLQKVSSLWPHDKIKQEENRCMIKEFISLLLATALVSFTCPRTFGARVQEQKKADQVAAAAKARITELGIGMLVEIKLRDKTKLKGYVGEIAEDHFVVTHPRTGTSTNVAYIQVQQVKLVEDHHLSDGKKSAIALGILIALFTWANWTNKP